MVGELRERLRLFRGVRGLRAGGLLGGLLEIADAVPDGRHGGLEAGCVWRWRRACQMEMVWV